LLTVRSWLTALTASHKHKHNACGAEMEGFVGGHLHQLSVSWMLDQCNRAGWNIIRDLAAGTMSASAFVIIDQMC